MKKRPELQTGLILAVGLLLAIGSILAFSSQQITKATERDRIANNMVREILGLSILTSDYLLHPEEERPQKQWALAHERIGRLLQSEEFQSHEERAILEDMRRTHQSIGAIFPKIVATHGVTGMEDEAAAAELRERLTGQLYVKMENLASGAFLLAELSRTELIEAEQTSDMVVGVLTIILAFVATRAVL